ncbi:hypothetical protein [Microbacterium kyungheense]|uniref:Uncharacterized protein n=1 Tax=Microbacterium kyungheense TaxID=1263636 RepID=A0A543F0Q8_9MICO|nr:hypothetical protein [Microbacterium kyungheense]TQM27370.1 hypothetical protein FB391_1383 [Microbacterium kyungheense]
MDDATIRRYLTEPRLAVLGIVSAGGIRDAGDVVPAWLESMSPITPAHERRLPRIARQLLWQLANLGWIERSDGFWTATTLGRHARDLAPVRG